MTVSANKRLREQRRREQQRDKEERRRQKREEAGAKRPATGPGGEPAEDPDIAGIIPGPQPIPEDS
jgi:hypothetical protein